MSKIVPFQVDVKIKRLSEDAIIPQYATSGSAGFDLVATEDVFIPPQSTVVIPTGWAVEVPVGFKLAVYPRSGISLKTPLRVGNCVGQVDADYRGEVKVIMHNTAMISSYMVNMAMGVDNKPVDVMDSVPIGTYVIRKGDRIAQGAIEEVFQAKFEVVEELSTTDRGDGGFGSTGTKSA